MERTWLEAIRLVGLDLQVGVVLLWLAAAGLQNLGREVVRRLRRRRRIAATRPIDPWPSQEWGPSH